MSWLIPRNELTPEQIRAIELAPTEHRAILGGPGSGKTQILLYRARHLADQLHVGNDRFRIFVYTNVLKDYIKSALSLLNLPDDTVITFDHWCRLFYQQHVNSRLPWNSEKKQPDFDGIRSAVLDRVTNGRVTLPIYDFVLVDEGQDLDEDVFTALSRIARHVTVCIDNKQQIYDNGSTEAGILYKLGLRKRNINLIEAFRVCPYLVEVAAQLIPDPAEREAFRQQKRTVQTERQTPLIYFARNFEDEKQMLYQMVRERQLMNDRIAILFPQNRQVFGFAQGLTEAGIEVEVPKQRAGNSGMPTHDFNSSRPKLMAYHSAKGLTFDSVFMPRLVPGSFQRVRPERIERLVFVALTRAAKWAYFSTSLDDSIPLFEKLLPLADTRQLTVRSGDQPGSAGTAARIDRPRPTGGDNLDFL
jgi:superfamily I DNA/RNA helicase